MDFQFRPEDQAFRRAVRGYLAAMMTPDFELEIERRHDERGFLQGISQKLAGQGWLTLAWPKEYGGGGASHVTQALLNEELGYFHVPDLAHIVGVNLVAPALMIHGTEEQKRKYLPGIARVDEVYAQGFTEPDAGSDIASLKTRAAQDGDNYVINGHKIWMGNAHISDTVYLAARTDPDAPRHRGISLFIVPLTLPGITVRPIPTLDKHFVNAIYFDDVVIPKDMMVGEKNKGWNAMVTTLDFERSGVGGAAGLRRNLEDLLAYARATKRHGRALADDPVLRHRFAEWAVQVETWRLLCWRIVAMQAKGLVPNIEGATSALIGKTLMPRFGEFVVDVMGPYSTVGDEHEPWAPLKGRMNRLVVSSILTHPGGTPETMKNIIAMRGLGLPRSY